MTHQISNRFMALALAMVGAWHIAQPVHAQTMYRCGNTYQDSPCQSAPANKTFNSSGAAKTTSASAAPVTDVQCSGRGAEAIKITWQREAGKTLEQQLTGVSSPTQRALIEETYGIRGTAPEVRSAIEAACMKRKEEAAKAAALIEAAKATDGAARPVSSAAGSAQAPQPQPTAVAQPKSPERPDSARQCESIQAQINSVKEQQRQGGSIAFQEELNSRRRDLERRASAAKC
jgi:hypothetical protein